MVLTPGRDLSRPPKSARFTVRQHLRRRLDLWLQERLGWSSRSKIQKLIQMRRVLLNGEISKPSAKVGCGDEVEVLLDAAQELEEVPPQLPILHEDPWLVAVNKSPGMLVHPVGKTHAGTVIDGIHRHWRDLNEGSSRKVIHRLCHRLDRDTSGLLLLAKTVAARRHLQDSFEGDRVRKSYLAVVEGVPGDHRFSIDAAISASIDRSRPHDQRLARADEAEGKASRTHFEVVARGAGISLILCRPITGRQNQIRIHLQVAGFPILGDTGYGQTPQSLLERGGRLPGGVPHPTRAMLHSFQLRFPHPIWNLPLELRCNPEGDMTRFLEAFEIDPARLPSLESSRPVDGTACQTAPTTSR